MSNVISYAAITGKNAKPLATLIEQAISHTKKGKDKIQLASVAIIMHGIKHGTCLAEQVDSFVVNLGDGINRAALQQFFINCGYTFEQDKEQGRLVCTGWDKDKARSKDTLEYAKSTYWTTTVKQAEAKVWSLADTFANLIATAKSKAKKLDSIKDSDLSQEEKDKLSALIDLDVELLRKLNLVYGGLNPESDNLDIEAHLLESLREAA